MVIFHHYICRFVFHNGLMVCSKLAKNMKPPRILVHTLFTRFKRHSHPVHILICKRTYLYINHGIRRREGMKEKLLCWTFFRRFSASAGRFRPSFSLLDRLFPVTLRAKRTAMQAPRHTSMRGKPLPQCCKHRLLASPTKLKPICTKSKFFTSLLLHSTSLLAI